MKKRKKKPIAYVNGKIFIPEVGIIEGKTLVTMYHPLTGEPANLIVEVPPTPDEAKIIDMKGKTFTPTGLEKREAGDGPKIGSAIPFKKPRAIINGKILLSDEIVEGKTLIMKSNTDYSLSDEKPDPRKYDITDAKGQVVVLTIGGKNAMLEKLKKFGADLGHFNTETGEVDIVHRASKGKS